jgi:hypothetical protein
VPEKAICWDLFEAAKMYDLDRLQKICLKSLCNSLNVNNCCRMLEAASLHDMPKLFRMAKRILKWRWAEVTETDDWKELVLNNKRLARKLEHVVCPQLRRSPRRAVKRLKV